MTVDDGIVLITGGAGFISSNLAYRLLHRGARVRLFDNLSRPGVERNLGWLQAQFEDRVQFVQGDIRQFDSVEKAVAGASVVYHLAAQVAVTTSVTDPRTDFETNALGTLNVLEAARAAPNPPVLLFTSTNKVYGAMDDVPVTETGGHYTYADLPEGIPERQPLDFHSPYGCSKGAADQYVRDYARIYDLRTVVFRMSCIYGPRQFGTEDQGWVAHFVISASLGRPVTIYGDGRQVRDILFVDDLIDAFMLATARARHYPGEVFNIGGGPTHTLSLLELVGILERRLGRRLAITFADWRPGDQRVYISDIRKAAGELGWRPRVPVQDGVDRLLAWVGANPELFAVPRV